MAESSSHKQAKNKAAGKSGSTEFPISGGRQLDAKTPKRATEVERSGSTKGLRQAARRLKSVPSSQKVLQVPEKDMTKAATAMREEGVSGSVKNMAGTKRRSV